MHTQNIQNKTKPETVSADMLAHICGAIQRQIQEEFPNFHLFFVPYWNGDIIGGLTSKKTEIESQPLLQPFRHTIKTIIETGRAPPHPYIGLSVKTKKTLMPLKFLYTHEALALFIFNADHMKDEEEARMTVLHLAYHGLSDYETRKKNNTLSQNAMLNAQAYENPLHRATQNLLGDVFTAATLHGQGQHSAWATLARKRCAATFIPFARYYAEDFPYPIVAEESEIIIDEFSRFYGNNTGVYQNALHIAQEIKATIDEQSIQQWQFFALAAQEMAWINEGADKNRILQSAIYSSEDPYIRAIAYIAADFLNIDPPPGIESSLYNPFTAFEANARLHTRQCESVFEGIFKRHASHLKTKDLLERIDKQTERQNALFLNGMVTGWCPAALKDAGNIVIEEQEKSALNNPVGKAAEIFRHSYNAVPYSALTEIGHAVFLTRRNGLPVTADLLGTLVEETIRKHPKLERSLFAHMLASMLVPAPKQDASP